MYNVLVLSINEQKVMKMIPPLFCHPQTVSANPQIWKQIIPPVSTLLTENNEFLPDLKTKNSESRTPSLN